MAKSDQPEVEADESAREPELVGYRLRRGHVVFRGPRHQTVARGTVVKRDDPLVPVLFQTGADLEPVME